MCSVFRKKNFPLASSELYSVFKELWCVFCKKVLVFTLKAVIGKEQ